MFPHRQRSFEEMEMASLQMKVDDIHVSRGSMPRATAEREEQLYQIHNKFDRFSFR